MKLDDLLFKLLTGRKQGEIQELAGVANALDERQDPENLRAHTIASNLMAKRIGPSAAAGVGSLWEILSGIKAALGGKPFSSPEGFSMEDIRANQRGVSGQDIPANLEELIAGQAAGEDLLLKELRKRKSKSNAPKEASHGSNSGAVR